MELDACCDVCYVCHEPCAVRSRCACAAHVHADCLVKTAAACNTFRCTICQTKIGNLKLVRVAHHTRAYETVAATEIALLCVFAVLFSTLSLLFFAASAEQLETNACSYAALSILSLALAICASQIIVGRTEPVTYQGITNVAVLI